MNKKVGFIGSGNMAKAMIGGLVESKIINPANIFASNRTITKLVELHETYGIQIAESNVEVAKKCDIIILSITPDQYASVIDEIKEDIQEEQIIVLIAGGQSIAANEERFERQVKMAKAMPNTPVLVGEGLTALSFNALMTEEDKQAIITLCESFGKAEVINETLMDTASAVGGSSPAFIYMYIEALADAAVLYGMPREKAYTIAAQAVLGSAKMVLETGEHPAKLKDDVCSPGGTTIQSVAALEESGFRSAVMQAIHANMAKLGEGK
ncbi:pyrroline-5-carboxylate reductase [Alkalihalobacillus sp. 1P02AB]|uniref:pyrroline-5-carboxylate reductase n=1 Tax=Alkalihalobacillus sp. 1P02AB TaxID=3132260 RepID=UPI0039A52525